MWGREAALRGCGSEMETPFPPITSAPVVTPNLVSERLKPPSELPFSIA